MAGWFGSLEEVVTGAQRDDEEWICMTLPSSAVELSGYRRR